MKFMGLAPWSRPPRPLCRERGCLRNQCVWSLDSPASRGKWTSCVGCLPQRAPVCDLIDLWVLGHPTVGGSLAADPRKSSSILIGSPPPPIWSFFGWLSLGHSAVDGSWLFQKDAHSQNGHPCKSSQHERFGFGALTASIADSPFRGPSVFEK